MKISPARTSAFDILKRIESQGAFSSILLPVFEDRLEAKDRGLCHELVLGVLRKQLLLDAMIAVLAGTRKLDIEIRIALRLGLYQILFLNKIPAHSAINESVNLAQRAKKTSAKGFVNAILRRASKEPINLNFVDDTERLSIETSHPRWLLEKWIDAFGFDEATHLAAANNEKPETSTRMTLMGDEYFQDEASQMVANALRINKNGLIWDVCAAPGGKTGLLAEHANKCGAAVLAGDIHWNRVEYLRENCRRQGVDFVKIVQYDAEKAVPFEKESFDSVLVDAPCSGTGTIRGNPEIRYSVKSSDFDELHSKQLGILENASNAVKIGGTVVYSTCSMEREENESVCEEFLARNTDFRKIKPNVDKKFITNEGFARTFPHRDGIDGFFIAEFERFSR